MPTKHSLKFSIGANVWGFLHLGAEYGIEWSRGVSAGDSFYYLDEIGDLRRELNFYKSRLAVFENHYEYLMDMRSSNFLNYLWMIDSANGLVQKSRFTSGIFSLPQEKNVHSLFDKPVDLSIYSLTNLLDTNKNERNTGSSFTIDMSGVSKISHATSKNCSSSGCHFYAMGGTDFCFRHTFLENPMKVCDYGQCSNFTEPGKKYCRKHEIWDLIDN